LNRKRYRQYRSIDMQHAIAQTEIENITSSCCCS